jgi:hypothetical protein
MRRQRGTSAPRRRHASQGNGTDIPGDEIEHAKPQQRSAHERVLHADQPALPEVEGEKRVEPGMHQRRQDEPTHQHLQTQKAPAAKFAP